MGDALTEIEAISNRDGEMVGVPTGFTDLDSLTNGLQFLNVAPAWQYVVKGVVLVVAVIADVYFRRNR